MTALAGAVTPDAARPEVLCHWLRVDFGGPEQVDTVRLYQYGGYELTAYRISGLVDGAWQARLHEIEVTCQGNTGG